MLLHLVESHELVPNETRQLLLEWVLVWRHHAFLTGLVEAQIAAETDPKRGCEAQARRPGKELGHFCIGSVHDVDSLCKEVGHRYWRRLANSTPNIVSRWVTSRQLAQGELIRELAEVFLETTVHDFKYMADVRYA